MKWTPEQLEQLKIMCMADVGNKEMAKQFDVPINEIHAKRSQLDLTKAKCLAILKQDEKPKTKMIETFEAVDMTIKAYILQCENPPDKIDDEDTPIVGIFNNGFVIVDIVAGTTTIKVKGGTPICFKDFDISIFEKYEVVDD